MKQVLAFSILVLALLSSCGGKKTVDTKVERKDISEIIFASGKLEADDTYNLTAQTEGYLVQVAFKEGDVLPKGHLVAVVDNKQSQINTASSEELLQIAQQNSQPSAPIFKQTESNLQIAQEKLKQDEVQMQRYKRLYEQNSVSRLEYENAQLAWNNSKAAVESLKQQYNNLKQQAEQQVVVQQSQNKVNKVFSQNNQIRAVVGGKVYKKLKQLGDYVRKGDIVAVIGNSNSMYAKLSIDETNMAKVKLNQEAGIQLNTNKNKVYKGFVSEIYPSFDENSQSFFIKVRFNENIDLNILGTQLEANIVVGNKAKALVIPRTYLGYGNKVKVKDKKDDVVVKTGFVSTQWVEVVDGLTEGETIQTDTIK